MKRFSIIAMLFFIFLSMESCKKCYECTALDEDGVELYRYLEICGTKGDFEAYQARCEAEFGSFGFTCSCGESE